MPKQCWIMKNGEADAWFRRNRWKLGMSDPVSDLIERVKIVPRSVLEIGCANGWRLAKLRDKYKCDVIGVDPSIEAAREAMQLNNIPVIRGAAHHQSADRAYDMVIFGFCLYVTDPEDWFYIAASANHALQENGYLIIHDFAEPARPFTRPYKHRSDVLAYHFDFSKLWLAHPAYVLAYRAIDSDNMVTILRKVTASAFEARE